MILSLLVFACHDPIDSSLVGTLPIQTITTPKDNAVMVYVPEGEFLMGTSDADIEHYKRNFPAPRYPPDLIMNVPNAPYLSIPSTLTSLK